ncbi:hypothetical protein [Peribacillus asahii]|nr:hypothetical protein [Peribacillus asahii]
MIEYTIYQRYPPLLGEHTDEVLNELGCSDTQIKESEAILT